MNKNTYIPKLIGGFGNKDFGKQFRQGNRVYDIEGIAPSITLKRLSENIIAYYETDERDEHNKSDG